MDKLLIISAELHYIHLTLDYIHILFAYAYGSRNMFLIWDWLRKIYVNIPLKWYYYLIILLKIDGYLAVRIKIRQELYYLKLNKQPNQLYVFNNSQKTLITKYKTVIRKNICTQNVRQNNIKFNVSEDNIIFENKTIKIQNIWVNSINRGRGPSIGGIVKTTVWWKNGIINVCW